MELHAETDNISDITLDFPPDKMRIVYWNASGSFDLKNTVNYFKESVKADVILLTNVGKHMNLEDLELGHFSHLHNGNPFNGSENIHCILVRDATVGPNVLDTRGWGTAVFQFQSIDVRLKDGIHRVVLVHSDSEEASLEALSGISEVLTPEADSSIEFAHLLGTLNTSEFRLQTVLPEGFQSLLDPEWETNNKRQDDMVLSKRITSPRELEGYAFGHKTFRWARFEPRGATLIEVGKGVCEENKLFCRGDYQCKEKSCDWFKHDYDEDDYVHDDYWELFEKKKANGISLLGDS